MGLKEYNKIKIINIFGRMDRGGAETGAIQALRRLDKSKFQYDFITLKEGQGYFDNEIKAFGSQIYILKYTKNLIRFYKSFKKLYNKVGPYPIIHSRVHHFSGFVIFMAKQLKIPIRIVHSHSAIPYKFGNTSVERYFYYLITKLLIKNYATVGIAVSKMAADSLFGKDWEKNPKFHVIYTGIDLTPFINHSGSNILKEDLGLPKNAIVIGHVGSFRTVKNHVFLVKLMKEIFKKNSNIHLLLCGQGPLKQEIEILVKQNGLSSNIHFLGFRDDIPQLMLNVMDLFVLPSIYEGLPNVGIEAQAAGIPVFFSDNITKEVNLIKSLVHYLPIDKGPDIWVSAILDLIRKEKYKRLPDAYKFIQNSEFDVNVGTQKLLDLYLNEYENYIRTRS